MLHAWVPLVPSTKENGCLRVIRGSHLIDVLLLCPKQGSHTLHTRRDPAGYLEIDSENETLQRYINEPGRVVDVQLAPGDVCFFKPGLIHSGYPNSSSGVRWSAEFRLQDAEVPTLRSESGDIARSLKQPKAAIVSGQQWESLPTFHGATALGYAIKDEQRLAPMLISPGRHRRSMSGSLAVMGSSAVALSRLREEGYAVVRGLLPADVVATARGVCERIVDGIARKLVAEGKAASAMEDEPFETRLARLFESHPEDAPRIFREELHTADMAKVFFCPALLDLVESALDSPEIRLDSDFAAYPKYSIRDEDALASARTMWHAARMHYDPGRVSESQIDESMRGMINVWTPLVRTRRRNGCVRVIPGSHKLDVLSMLPKQGGGYHASREKGYLEVDAELVRKHEGKAVDVELEPGDV